MKLITYLGLIAIALSPWVPILVADHRLKEAVLAMCPNSSNPYTECSVLAVQGRDGDTLHFYNLKDGKFYRFRRERGQGKLR